MSISNQAVNSEATAVATPVEDYTSFVFTSNDDIKTTSLIIAEKFGKRHDNVLRDIDAILSQVSDSFGKLNFEEFENEYKNNLGLTARQRCFNITKDGLVIIVMGYTGAVAMTMKESYINAFNFMREELAKPPYGLKDIPHQSFAPLHLTQQMCGHIQRLANERAAADGVHYSTTYRQLKDAFECNTYTDIPVTKYGKVCRWFGVEPIYPIPVYSMIDNDELQRLLHIERGIMADPKLLPAPEGTAWAQVKDSEIVIDGKQHEELKAAHAQLEALKTGDETALPKVRGKRWTIIAKSERVVEFAVLDALYKTEAKVGMYEVLDGMFPTPRPTATQTVIEKQRLGELEFIAKYAAALMQQ